MKRTVSSSATLILTVIIGSLFVGASVSAHAILDSSSPSSSSVVAVSPPEILLDFNEQIEKTFADIRLFDADQGEVNIEKTIRSISDASIVTAQVPPLKDGMYVAVWRVVSADGHPATGAFPFEVGSGSSDTAVDLVQKVLMGIDKSSDLSYPMAMMRLLSILGVIVLIGAMSVNWRSAPFSEPRLFRLARQSTIAIAVGSIGVLLLQGPVASGKSWSAIFDSQLFADVLPTRLGFAILIRLVAVVIWGGLLISVAQSQSKKWRLIAVAASALLIGSYSMSGHPSAAGSSLVYVLVDAVHLTATSLWAGALVALVFVAKSERSGEYLLQFSRLATFAMPITVLTGVAQGLHLVGGVNRLNDTDYGKLLIFKLVLVAIIIAIGTFARRRLQGANTLGVSRIIRIEAVIVILVLAVTSLLLGKSPVSTDSFDELTFSATLVQSEVVGDFSIVPTKVGAAEVHTIFSPPGGSLSPIAKVTVTFLLPEKKIPGIPVTMSSVGPNHWIGVVQFPYSGQWEMQVRASPKENQTLLFTTEVEVAA